MVFCTDCLNGCHLACLGYEAASKFKSIDLDIDKILKRQPKKKIVKHEIGTTTEEYWPNPKPDSTDRTIFLYRCLDCTEQKKANRRPVCIVCFQSGGIIKKVNTFMIPSKEKANLRKLNSKAFGAEFSDTEKDLTIYAHQICMIAYHNYFSLRDTQKMEFFLAESAAFLDT